MNGDENKSGNYQGFEQGPIRPPSEGHSLFIRVTRNCPWNKCTFCPVYKGDTFSLRLVEHVKRDIDTVYRHYKTLSELAEAPEGLQPKKINELIAGLPDDEFPAFQSAYNWFIGGGEKSVFLQDANSLIIKPAGLVEILRHLRQRFPMVERITSYARAQTISRRKDEDLRAIHDAGLNRIHIGLESGSDRILAMVQKGVTKEEHITAGQKVRRAGMELSEYVMPGLGGRILSAEHARETADALNRINPDFIRLRTLAIPENSPLFEDYTAGRFQKCTDREIAGEILQFIEQLDGVTSAVRSDHILNLFQDLEGALPGDKERMTGILRTFLAMAPERGK